MFGFIKLLFRLLMMAAIALPIVYGYAYATKNQVMIARLNHYTDKVLQQFGSSRETILNDIQRLVDDAAT